jgi:malonyl-CoA O-methyltransferase
MNRPSSKRAFILPERKAVRRAFDKAAPTYDAAAVLQREVGQRLLERLDYMRLAPARILDLGSGTGFATTPLSTRYAEAQLISLDLAPGMLRHARTLRPTRGLGGWLGSLFQGERLHWLCADGEQLPLADNSMDLVFSNLALQWCDPKRIFAEAERVLKPGGLLLFSTFGPDTLKELRTVFSEVDATPHVNEFIDMHDLGDTLVQARFADPVMDMENITLTYQDVTTLMRELKDIGAHNVLPGRTGGLMGKTRWQRMCASYEQFRRDGRLPATYEVLYGHAWKSTQKKTAPGVQVIQFQPGGKRS